MDGATRPWSFFVKVMQSWSRSPLFETVPEDIREMAAAGVPWRTESLVYRSDLATRLPDGLLMPAAHGVFDLDEESASIWLEEVDVPAAAVPWDLERFGLAAHLLGRMAASPAVAELAEVGRDGWTVADYFHGRLTHQVVPMLRDPDLWHHPLMAGTFDAELRERLLAAADRAADHVAELGAMPMLTGHGDACPNNLLPRPRPQPRVRAHRLRLLGVAARSGSTSASCSSARPSSAGARRRCFPPLRRSSSTPTSTGCAPRDATSPPMSCAGPTPCNC